LQRKKLPLERRGFSANWARRADAFLWWAVTSLGANESYDRACISSRHRERRRPSAIRLFFLLAASVLVGCSMSDGIGPYITDPGEFSVFRCDDLKTRLTQLLEKENKLSNLMDKASEGGGGTIIGVLTYRPEYELVVGEEKVLRRTAAEKKCELAPPASAASATAPNFQSDQIIH